MGVSDAPTGLGRVFGVGGLGPFGPSAQAITLGAFSPGFASRAISGRRSAPSLPWETLSFGFASRAIPGMGGIPRMGGMGGMGRMILADFGWWEGIRKIQRGRSYTNTSVFGRASRIRGSTDSHFPPARPQPMRGRSEERIPPARRRRMRQSEQHKEAHQRCE